MFAKSLTVALLIGLGMTLPIEAQQAAPTVIQVVDGDDVQVRQQGREFRIRLGCIDAPEMGQSPWGQQSKSRLQQLLSVGTTLRLREINRDEQGRMVAEVYKAGQLINLQLVREGYAVVFPRYIAGCAATNRQYLQAQASARQRRLAFWNQANPEMPWDFRRIHRREEL